uniref:Uncharacterized protein n=1 Tax=Anguilla anguilla TaxID=7936 RepID=A0A0E9WCY5_ANGAN
MEHELFPFFTNHLSSKYRSALPQSYKNHQQKQTFYNLKVHVKLMFSCHILL